MNKAIEFNKNIMVNDFEELLKKNNNLEFFAGKTILIAGATSFLLTYFIKFVLYCNDINVFKKNVKILAMVRNEKKASKLYCDYIGRNDFKIINHDVNECFDYDEHIDVIINAASQASPKYYGIDPVGTLTANIIGNYNLLEFAKKKGVENYLFFSSGEVYGETNVNTITEKSFGYLDCATVRACYGEGKRAGETLCVAYSHQYNINAKSIRLYHTYGPGMPFEDGRIFADFARNICNSENIVLKSDGSAIRSFCYVTDMIDGMIKVITKGEKAEAYNIANPNETYSIAEIANILCQEFAERKIKVIYDIPVIESNVYLKSPVKGSIPSIEKMKTLGFSPSINIKDGFRRVVESYEQLNH